MAERNKIITVRDLQTFIEAVEFASDLEEWVPSAKQWKRIREMINNLEDPVPAQITPQDRPFEPPVYVQPPTMAAPVYATPPGLATSFGPPGSNGIPNGYPTGIPQSGPFSQGPVPIKTPDVDTSGGKGYQSSFA
jgi:hypothetical protein